MIALARRGGLSVVSSSGVSTEPKQETEEDASAWLVIIASRRRCVARSLASKCLI